jgi:two-component system, OmpR family, heavy metal sensor histidine kinase CusS
VTVRLSLTARIGVLFTLISASILMGLGWLISTSVERHFVDLDRAALQDKLHLIQEIGAESTDRSDLAMRLADVLQSHKDLAVRIQSGSDVVFATSDETTLTLDNGVQRTASVEGLFSWKRNGLSYRALEGEMAAPGASAAPMNILVVLNTQHHARFKAIFEKTLLIYIVVATLICGALGWLAAHSGLRPLRKMRAQAGAVNIKNLDQRMPVETIPIEMADLAQTLNDMFQRLQIDFQRLTEFSSDLAHELRTPICNMLTETQVGLSQQRTVAQHEEILASNSEELQRLTRMVSDMLYLATTENGISLPNPEIVVLEDEVSALFDFYEALAEESRIALVWNGQGATRGDRLMIRRAISNLMSNALRHTSPGRSVEVSIEPCGSGVTVHVSNAGADIPTSSLPRLFDRFYRADSSRTHPETGGAGLGLSITQAIMRAHGGEAFATSQGGTTCFSLNFPGDAD